MSDDRNSNDSASSSETSVSRRAFGAFSLGAGLAAASVQNAGAAALALTETDVTIKTPDGNCDAAFIHPGNGAYPGVIIWTDIFGLRPSMRGFARRLAADGYSVLVPNPFYRTAKAPVFEDPTKFNFANPADTAKLPPLTGPINADGAIERDAIAFVGFLDSQASVNKNKKIGTQGYCMGGPLVVRTAAAVPNRIGAGGSFHGGGLVTDMPNSPHLLASNIKARMYFGVAVNDDMRQPDAKDKLKAAFTAANVPVEVEVYAKSQHGWCVPDMPLQANGQPIYNRPDAEIAWSKLQALYKAGIA